MKIDGFRRGNPPPTPEAQAAGETRGSGCVATRRDRNQSKRFADEGITRRANPSFPFERIVVAVDLSRDDGHLIAQAAELSRHAKEVILLHCMEPAPGMALLPVFKREAVEFEARRTANGALRQYSRQLRRPGLRTGFEIVDGQPARAIAAFGRKHDADLLVVGARGRTRLNRFLFNNVAESLVRDAQTNVWISVARNEAYSHRRILLPTDFSLADERALAAIMTIAEAGDDITLLHSRELVFGGAGHWADATIGGGTPRIIPVDHGEDQRILRFEAIEQRYSGRGVTISLEVEYGSLRLNIPHRLAEGDVNLLVLNNRAQRGVARLSRKGLVASIAGQAPCSVLVLRDPAGFKRAA